MSSEAKLLVVLDVGRILLRGFYRHGRERILGHCGEASGLFGFLEVVDEVLRRHPVSHVCALFAGSGAGRDEALLFGCRSPFLPGYLSAEALVCEHLCRDLGIQVLKDESDFGSVAIRVAAAAAVEEIPVIIVSDRVPGSGFGDHGVQVLDPSSGCTVLDASTGVGGNAPEHPSGLHRPPAVDLSEFVYHPVDPARAARILEDLGLVAFVQIPLATPGSGDFLDGGGEVSIDTAECLAEFIDGLRKAGRYALHAERVTGSPRAVSLYFLSEPGSVHFISVSRCAAGGSETAVFELLAGLLGDARCTGIVHDVKGTGAVLESVGLPDVGLQFDTMLADLILTSAAGACSLESLALRKLGVRLPPRGDDDVHQSCRHGGAAARAIWRLAARLSEELEKEPESLWLFKEVEVPAAKVVRAMEATGFLIDKALLSKFEELARVKQVAIRRSVETVVGRAIDIGNHKAVGDLLFLELGLPPGRRTKHGGYSTDADVLEALRGKHPVVTLIEQSRAASGLQQDASTYLSQLDKSTGRLHASMNPIGAVTGRLSTVIPNLQGVPSKPLLGCHLRTAFLPSPGYVLISADYSQVELRVLGHLSGDEGLIKAFKSGKDFHSLTASELLEAFEGSVDTKRSLAKKINFGIAYGMGPASLAKECRISVKEAGRYRSKWFRRHPGVVQFKRKLTVQAAAGGILRTLCGRNLPVTAPDRKGQRQLLNHVVQGSAADLMKLAMVNLERKLREGGLDARMLLTVHDEVILEARESQAEDVARLVKSTMEGALELKTGLVVEVRSGQNWGKMDKLLRDR